MTGRPTYFSNINRKERLSKAEHSSFDLIVIGGGITGAGIALDASLRNMKVLLVEKLDFASGTSSRSTKLIHGGLRYLKNLEFGLVRETGVERHIAHKNICHLVHPEKMLLPIVNGGSFNRHSANLAIGVYDLLAGVPKAQRKKKMNKDQTMEEEPLLKSSMLKSGILYSEYRTDDARLTMELIKAAVRNGASVFNYMKVKDFAYENGKVKAAICEDLLNQTQLKFNTNTIVSAAGPWVDELRQTDNPNTSLNLHLTKGVHIVLNKEDLNIKRAIYFDAFDGRMIFAIPRGENVYVGTTDTSFKGNKDELLCTTEDAQYLINAVNGFFDIDPLNIDHINSSWTGLRPLIQKKGKSPSELSRKDEIFISTTGLLSIAGGKLTGFRKMAERVVDLVYKLNEKPRTASKTKNYKIHHQPFFNYQAFNDFSIDLCQKYKDSPISTLEIETLVSNFGKDAAFILSSIEPRKEGEDHLAFHKRFVQSQLDYTMNYESVAHPMDFINRRTAWSYFNIRMAKDYLPLVSEEIADQLHYTSNQKSQQLASSQLELDQNSLAFLKTPRA